MSLDPKKLEKLVNLADGMTRARCPACAENGQDKKGEHLRIYPDGRFGCCVHPKDREHRKRIFALAGEHVRRGIKVRVAPAKASEPIQSGFLGRLGRVFGSQNEVQRQPDAPDGASEVKTQFPNTPDGPDGVGEVQTRFTEGRTPRTGETKSSGDVCPTADEPRTPRTGVSNSKGGFVVQGNLPIDESRTPRTPLENSRVYAERVPSEEGINVSTYKEFRGGVRGVRGGEGVEQPPETAEKQERMPYFTPGGTLVIPFDSPARFHWWKGGQSVAATIAEVRSWTGKN